MRSVFRPVWFGIIGVICLFTAYAISQHQGDITTRSVYHSLLWLSAAGLFAGIAGLVWAYFVRRHLTSKLDVTVCAFVILFAGFTFVRFHSFNVDDSFERVSRYFQQQIALHKEYESGDPIRAKEALNKKIEATKLASTDVVSDFEKLQSQAFELTRLAMIEEYLGREESAELLKKEALRKINEWCVLAKRETVGYDTLLQSVIGADQEFKAPWHPRE